MEFPEYLDFDVHIDQGSGGDYRVSVGAPGGEARATMRLPFNPDQLTLKLTELELAVAKSGTSRRDLVGGARGASVKDFGTQLFDALFTDKVNLAFRKSQIRARDQHKGLRLRLRIDAPDLSALPWEFLYDDSIGDYICLSSQTPVVRYLDLDLPAPETLIVKPPLAMLVMIASPNDREPLNVGRERERIQEATAGLQEAGLLQIQWMQGSNWDTLQRTLRDPGNFHIFHFVGHGGFDEREGGVLAFTSEAGSSQLHGATEVGSLLADERSLRLVVLNSCLGARGNTTNIFSSISATLVRRGVPAVAGMQYEISDVAATEFSRSLYAAIADGWPIDAAVGEARKNMRGKASNSVEWGTPVLHMRSPDGVLFKLDKSQLRTASRPGVVEAPPSVSTPPLQSTSVAVSRGPSAWDLQPWWAFLALVFAPPLVATPAYFMLNGMKTGLLPGVLLTLVVLASVVGFVLRRSLGQLWQVTLVVLFVVWVVFALLFYVVKTWLGVIEYANKRMTLPEVLFWTVFLGVIAYFVVVLVRSRFGRSTG